MFTLKSGRLPPADVKNIIFFVRPRLELMDIIAENVFRSVSHVKPHNLKADKGIFISDRYFQFFAKLSTQNLTLWSWTVCLQWGQATFVQRLPHFVCASAEPAVWTAAEGAGRVGLFHQHWWVHPGPDPLWWRPALHGVWKCFQGVFKLYIPDIYHALCWIYVLLWGEN